MRFLTGFLLLFATAVAANWHTPTTTLVWELIADSGTNLTKTVIT